MLITKKNYEKALAEQKAAINLEWERKWAERDEQMWRRESEDRYREETSRHFANIEKRLYALEKKAGLVEETISCPFENKAVSAGC